MHPLSLLPLVLAYAHPSLYYGAADTQRLQTGATSTHASIATALLAGQSGLLGGTSRPDTGGVLTSLAVSCVATGDARYCQKAHDWTMAAVASLPSSGNWEPLPDFRQASYLRGMSIAYDLLSDPALPVRFSSAELDQLRTRIAQGAAHLYGVLVNDAVWYTGLYTQNHNWNAYSALGFAAVTLYGEVPAAATWLNLAVLDYQKVGKSLDLIGDGSWHEGYSYAGASVNMWITFPQVLKRAIDIGRITGVPDLSDNAMMRNFAHFRAVGSLPGRLHQHVLAHGDYFGYSHEEVIYVLRCLARRFGDGEAQWLANQQAQGRARTTYAPEQEAIALEFLSFDPAVAPVAPVKRELYLSDLAGYIARSGYDANAVVLGVKAGALGGLHNFDRLAAGQFMPGESVDFGHDHLDDLSFWLYGEGEWLAPEAAAYQTHPDPQSFALPAWNTDMHNTFTVDGTGQIHDGSRFPGTRGGDAVNWTRRSSVTGSAATEHFSFVELEGKALYPASLGLTAASRQVLFVNRRTVVVRDHLASSAPHTFQWNSHALDGAARDGSWIRGVGKNGKALAVRVITPESFTETFTDQYAWVNTSEKFDPDEHVMRIRLAPTAPAREARFLTVMTPTTVSGWAARTDVQPYGDAAKARGFATAGGRFLMGDETGTTQSGGDLTLTGRAGGVVADAAGVSYVLFFGTALLVDGAEALRAAAQTGGIEVRVEGTALIVSAEGVSAARVLAPGATSATWNGRPVPVRTDPADAKYVLLDGSPAPTGGAPVISKLRVVAVMGTRATVTWTTDVPADSQVEYGPTADYGASSTLVPALSTSHGLTLTGLTAGGVYHLRARSSDAAGKASTSPDLSFVSATPACVSASTGGGWTHGTLPVRTGAFTAEFDATPTGTGLDSVIALSPAPGSAYPDFACLVAFTTGGTVVVRNGADYSSAMPVPYVSGSTYHFRLAVDVPTHRYSVWVTPPEGGERLLAQDYAFRSEQAAATGLASWGVVVAAGSGSTEVCNFSAGLEAPEPDESGGAEGAGPGPEGHADSLTAVGCSCGATGNAPAVFAVILLATWLGRRRPASGAAPPPVD